MPDPLAGLNLPAWLAGAVPLRRLGAGPVSDSWRLRTRERDVWLRRDRPVASALGLDREREARVLRVASGAGLAPQPLFVDPSRGVLVSAWVGRAGGLPESEGAEASLDWRELGALLRRVHGLPVEDVAALDLPAVAGRYARVAGTREAFALARRIGERAPALFASAPPRLCHNDAHLGNVLAGPPSLLFDWEYAAAGPPLFDLAAVAGFHALDESAIGDLLGGWAGNSPLADTGAFPEFLDLYRDVAAVWAMAVGRRPPS